MLIELAPVPGRHYLPRHIISRQLRFGTTHLGGEGGVQCAILPVPCVHGHSAIQYGGVENVKKPASKEPRTNELTESGTAVLVDGFDPVALGIDIPA